MSRVRLSDYADDSWASEPYLTMYADGNGRTGVFVARHGFVRVFVSRGRHEATFMVFIWDGRCFTRKWKTIWGDKTISRLAREFADDVVGGRA